MVGDVEDCGNVTMGGRVASCVVDLSGVRGRSGGWIKGLTKSSSPVLVLFVLASPCVLLPCEWLACTHSICWPLFTPVLICTSLHYVEIMQWLMASDTADQFSNSVQ